MSSTYPDWTEPLIVPWAASAALRGPGLPFDVG